MTAALSRRWARIAIGFVVPALFLSWWQWQASSGDARSLAFAPLQSIGSAFVELAESGSLLSDMVSTLSRSLTGLALGGTLGVALGVAMAVWRPLDRVLGPLLHAIRQVPLIGWLPLIGLWFGTGQGSELIVVSISAFFPTLLNSYAGVTHVEPRYLDVGRIYGFTPLQRFRLILLPAAMPLILTGLTQGLAFAWIASIATEILLGVGGGLGVTMQVAQTQQQLDIILVAIIATAILGFVINQLFLRLRRHLLRWQAVPL
ncbi:ABC transporter permease [Sphingomonas sp. DG1-23]|uniref:ABC transporter permease n=1 Tax=Sphingomonas sp. DG1-23 TaxID=3068316 RepID=UPI00273D3F17|nr:ABC transporter permease [Sphingomonas sp. DG1-23]MDP5278272.1 ABC transporter permease [Sphingomonas sp. DG1-23]